MGTRIAFPRIVVFGLYKTDTTALFANIRNSLPNNPRLLFEKKSYTALKSDLNEGVLAKVIIGDFDTDYSSSTNFEKKILIIRDPRDWIVSGCLFLVQETKGIYEDLAILSQIQTLFKEKEESPQRHSFCDILSFILSYTSIQDLNGLKIWISNLHRDFIRFDQNVVGGFNIHYEDIVDRKTQDLSDYLGVKINLNFTLDKAHSHVPRTCGYGNWKDWFTPKDIVLLKPIFQEYIEYYKYDSDWQLRDFPQIKPVDCSRYIEKIVRLRLDKIKL